jgi:hypothetical protein
MKTEVELTEKGRDDDVELCAGEADKFKGLFYFILFFFWDEGRNWMEGKGRRRMGKRRRERRENGIREGKGREIHSHTSLRSPYQTGHRISYYAQG